MGGNGGGPIPDPAPDAKEVKNRLMHQMRAAFIAFVTTGDPNTSLLPPWGKVTPGNYERMHLGRECAFVAHDTPQALTDFPDDVIHLER